MLRFVTGYSPIGPAMAPSFLNAALEIAVSIAVFRLPHGTLLTLRGFGIQLRLDSVACWGWENGLQVLTLSEQGG